MEKEFCIFTLLMDCPFKSRPYISMRRIYTITTFMLTVLLFSRCDMKVQEQISLPPVAELPVVPELPDPLVSLAGEEIASVEMWESERRPEILRLFSEYMYGYLPPPPDNISFEIESVDDGYLDGAAIKKQIRITYGPPATPPIYLLLVIPGDHPDPVPVFLGPNFHANHAVLPDTDIPLSTVWQPERGAGVVDHLATEASRGTSISRWSIEEVVARGYASATFYHGDLDPDKNDFTDGIHAAMRGADEPERTATSWGSLAAWAYGVHRAVDYLISDPDIDAARIAVMGHSRNGKAALLAGATDERIALVISNQSGCGGAALSRRREGETVDAINGNFPHWFNLNFRHFNNNEDQLPFDQHMLLALIAPRPVLLGNAVASAREDAWADPEGEFLALKAAEPVYKLYGKAGLIVDEMPPINQLVGAEQGYHIRPGPHGVGSEDWRVFMDFADQFLKK